jgi:EAL domain-containing protein (putative c-di-GMP-specific phosphodiesterase class I)
MSRVLLVDDEKSLRVAMRRLLVSGGHEVHAAEDGKAALDLMNEHSFDVLLSDIRMPGMDGMALLRAVRDRDLDLPVVFLTGSPTLETAMAALEFGAFRYLMKPVDATVLLKMVARAAQARQLALARRDLLAEGHGSPLGDRAALESRFASGLEKMWMAMQPILSWRTRSVFGYEALLRTDEPAFAGSPVAFLDAAERLHRGVELGRRIRRRIAEQLAAIPTNAAVLVNLRPADIIDDELCSADGVLSPFAHGVILEVTERAALEQVPGLSSAVQRLRRLGYRLALDDLGAGYAGLSSFALLEPEIVKVDMSLVRGIHASPTKQRVFRTLAAMCRESNTEIVAEGVELAEERDCLTELGGDLYQGFLFARPGRGFVAPLI